MKVGERSMAGSGLRFLPRATGAAAPALPKSLAWTLSRLENLRTTQRIEKLSELHEWSGCTEENMGQGHSNGICRMRFQHFRERAPEEA